MTPKDKAKELVDKYDELFTYPTNKLKQCALIAVDEILSVLWHTHSEVNLKIWNYWQEVKQEIEKL